jgi:hypothetical protein
LFPSTAPHRTAPHAQLRQLRSCTVKSPSFVLGVAPPRSAFASSLCIPRRGCLYTAASQGLFRHAWFGHPLDRRTRCFSRNHKEEEEGQGRKGERIQEASSTFLLAFLSFCRRALYSMMTSLYKTASSSSQLLGKHVSGIMIGSSFIRIGDGLYQKHADMDVQQHCHLRFRCDTFRSGLSQDRDPL